jgi:Outer membrane protein beta-barrel domain
MKQHCHIVLLFLIIPFFAQAQVEPANRLYIGPTMGARLSTVTFFEDRARRDFNSIPAPGFDFGLMISRRIREKFYLNAQLIYSQRGKHIVGPENYVFDPNIQGPDPLFKNIQTNRYIELPIYYMLEFKRTVGSGEGMGGKMKAYRWFIGAGPTVSYWMGGRGKLQSSWLKEDLIDHMKYKTVLRTDSLDQPGGADKMLVTDPNRFQFAINFTGGIALEPVGFQKIVISAHLEIGQSFIGKNNDGFFPGSKVDRDELQAKYHSIRFSVGYLFDTKIEKKKRGKSTIKNKSSSSSKGKKKR